MKWEESGKNGYRTRVLGMGMNSNSIIRRILHVDVDAFAVGVERLLDPQLKRKPLIIGNEGGGRGIVACASYEARRSGVRAGMPLVVARRKLPEGAFRPETPEKYDEFSLALLRFFHQRVPLAERASLDDFYLDLTGCERWCGGDVARWATRLRTEAEECVGLPLSKGLASNKLVARIATCLGKPGGVVSVAPGSGA